MREQSLLVTANGEKGLPRLAPKHPKHSYVSVFKALSTRLKSFNFAVESMVRYVKGQCSSPAGYTIFPDKSSQRSAGTTSISSPSKQ